MTEIMTDRALTIAGYPPDTLRHPYYNQATTAAGGADKSKAELLAEFEAVRQHTRDSFRKFTENELRNSGTLDGFRTSVRVIAICIAGHQQHHFDVIANRYLD